jgi:hypothetical protein
MVEAQTPWIGDGMCTSGDHERGVVLSLCLCLTPGGENSIISVDHTSFPWCSCMKKTSVLDATAAATPVTVVPFSFGAVSGTTAATC